MLMLIWVGSMPGYRVCFFKTLLSPDGHPFKRLQQCVDVGDAKTAPEAVDHASRRFEALRHIADWTLHADKVEVVEDGRYGLTPCPTRAPGWEYVRDQEGHTDSDATKIYIKSQRRLPERLEQKTRLQVGDEFFEPEMVKKMGIAFERVCKDLGLPQKDDLLNRTMARAIVEKARTGIHDASDLAAAVLDEFGSTRPRSPSPVCKPRARYVISDYYLRTMKSKWPH
jgi:hypothetical protein